MTPFMTAGTLARRLEESDQRRQALAQRLETRETTHAPVLESARRPFWAIFRKKRSPFALTPAQVENWLTEVRAKHPLQPNGQMATPVSMGGRDRSLNTAISMVADKPASK